MKPVLSPYTFPDRVLVHSRRHHLLHLFIMSFLVVVISMAAIFYSLGYKINWTTKTIQQTGLLQLESPIRNLEATVVLDGKSVASRLPSYSDPLFPGQYRVEISKQGYQSWSRIVEVSENKVSAFRSVVLIKEKPTTIEVSESDKNQLLASTNDERSIERRENELWANDTFITRLSADIVAATWYPGREHIVYQAGNEVWLIELDSLRSQKLATLEDSQPSLFRFKNGGRVLLYTDAAEVKGLSLFN